MLALGIGGVVRSTRIVGTVAIALAVAAADAAPALAQAPVPPAAVVTAQPDDPSKAGDDKPKVETSGNPGDAKPEPEKPKGEEPKPVKPAEPKAD